MKALHLVKTVHGAKWALRQVAALRRLGVDITVALPATDRGLAREYVRAGAEVLAADLDFSPARPWSLPAAIRRCRALVARARPDVIHSHFVSTTLVARLALGRTHPVPRIFQVPGPLHLEHPTFRNLDLATSGERDYWIGSCRWTCEEYARQGVDADRLFLSYYGTDLGHDGGTGRGAFRQALGIGPEISLLGMVAYTYAPKWLLGQQRGLKGHEDFIDAFRSLRKLIPTARAVIVGGAWNNATRYERRLQRRAHAACGDALRFVGKRDDIPAVYADLSLAVHPSLSENCGAAVESLSAGCPTVATSVGGLPDVVIDGRTGWLVPPRCPERLAAAMREALADGHEARRRAHAGQALVRGLFAVERTAGEIASIYRHVLDREAGLSSEHFAEGVAFATG